MTQPTSATQPPMPSNTAPPPQTQPRLDASPETGVAPDAHGREAEAMGGGWVLALFTVILGVVVGVQYLLIAIFGAESAPQQAGAGAVACAGVVVPYCIMRSVQVLLGGE